MMLPDTGKHVRVVFRNGTVIDGIVKEWVSNYVQLESLTDQSMIIITHPEEDIMLIKILLDPPAKSESVPEKQQIRKLADQLLEVPETEAQADLQQKSMAELKRMVVDQDRKMIQRKIREHFPSGYTPHKPDYGRQIDMIPPAARRRRNG